MDVFTPYVTNGIGIMLLLILRYVSNTSVSRQRSTDLLFKIMLYGIMFGC